MSDAKLRIELSQDEALVLFDFLSRFDADDDLRVEDRAEEVVLWRMLAVLEKSLVEPFMPEYRSLLLEARGRVRDSS